MFVRWGTVESSFAVLPTWDIMDNQPWSWRIDMFQTQSQLYVHKVSTAYGWGFDYLSPECKLYSSYLVLFFVCVGTCSFSSHNASVLYSAGHSKTPDIVTHGWSYKLHATAMCNIPLAHTHSTHTVGFEPPTIRRSLNLLRSWASTNAAQLWNTVTHDVVTVCKLL